MRLRVHESWGWEATVRVTVLRDGEPVDVFERRNQIHNAGRDLARDVLRSEVDGRIRFVALSDSTDSLSPSASTLAGEQFRRQITKQDTGATGVLLTTAWIAPGQANDFTIRRIGWFAGPSATATPDSGILVASFDYVRAKNVQEALLIERQDVLGGI